MADEPGRAFKGFGLAARYAKFMDRHRRVVLALSVLTAAVATLLAAHMKLKPDFADLLPPFAESVQQLEKLAQRARLSSTVLIGVESQDVELREEGAQILAHELSHIDPSLVASITVDDAAARGFAWQHRFLYTPLEELKKARDQIKRKLGEANPFFVPLGDDEKNKHPASDELQELKKRLDELERDALTGRPRVSADGRLQLIVLRTTFSSDEVELDRRLLNDMHAAISRAAARTGPRVSFGLGGDVVSTVAHQKGLLHGIVLATVLVVGLVLLALLWFYRSPAMVLALLWALAVGSLATFGFAKIAIGHLNLASAFLSSIVIGNGINSGIILLARYAEERRKGVAYQEALAASLAGTLPGTLAAMAAATVAYGSLSITQFRGFRDFGIIGGTGMILCWLSSYLVMPPMLATLERHGWIKAGPEPKVVGLLRRTIPNRPGYVSAAAALVFLVMSAIVVHFLTRSPIEVNLRNIQSYSAELRRQSAWMEKFDAAFGQGITGGFAVGTSTRQEAEAVAEKFRAADRGKPEAARLFTSISTIEDLLPGEQEEKLALLAEIRKMLSSRSLSALSEEDRRVVDSVRPPAHLQALTVDDLPASLTWPYTERDGTRGRLVLANVGPGVDPWNLDDLRRFADSVRAMHLGPDVLIGGTAFVFSDMLDAMYRYAPRASIAAAIGSTIVVVLLGGLRRYALPTLFCGALGTLSMVAIASLLGLKINFLDFVALPITIGIGIDYAVNIAARTRLSPDKQQVAAIGGAVAMCSYTTVVGYGSLLLSQNRGIHSFGLCAMLGELTCLFVALLVAPALLSPRRFCFSCRSKENASGNDHVRARARNGQHRTTRDATLSLRVCIALPYDLSEPGGGVKHHAFGLARALRKHGDQVMVVGPARTSVAAEQVFTFRGVVDMELNGSFNRLGLLTNPCTVRAFLRRHTFDIIHLHEPFVPGFSFWISWFSPRVPKICTFHSYAEAPSWLARFGMRLGALVQSPWIRRGTAVSLPAAEMVAHAWRRTLQIIPNGIHADVFTPDEQTWGCPSEPISKQRPLRLLFVGRLSDQRKGFRYLAQAYQRLRASGLPVVLDAAGEIVGPSLPPQCPGLHYHGPVSLRKLIALYRSCDVLVAPSTGQESFGIILLEGMASGCAVVCSDIAGYRQVIDEHGAYFCPVGDAEALAAGVRALANDPARRAEMSRWNRARALLFDWAAIAARVREEYLATIEGLPESQRMGPNWLTTPPPSILPPESTPADEAARDATADENTPCPTSPSSTR